MKKITSDIIFQLLFGILSIALILAGSIIFVASFFEPLPIFNAIVLIALGSILLMSIRLYNTFLDIISIWTKTVKDINQADTRMRENFMPPPMNNIISKEIHIDENTSPEEIEKLKRDFPVFAPEIDRVLSEMHGGTFITNMPKPITLLSLSQLDEELKKAIEDDNFEKASEIKNEINRRKV